MNSKRRMKSCDTYGKVKTEADKKIHELAKGSQAAALIAGQARDAINTCERLQGFFLNTGRNPRRLSVGVFASE